MVLNISLSLELHGSWWELIGMLMEYGGGGAYSARSWGGQWRRGVVGRRWREPGWTLWVVVLHPGIWSQRHPRESVVLLVLTSLMIS